MIEEDIGRSWWHTNHPHRTPTNGKYEINPKVSLVHALALRLYCDTAYYNNYMLFSQKYIVLYKSHRRASCIWFFIKEERY